ncbi:MAG: GspH/FimT family pseudopilin [Planctomycetota bacterium]|jgi:type II secretory pathway pseudopilin PulG
MVVHETVGPVRSAFTLLELVMILAIVATLAAIAAPRYAAALTSYRADGAGRRIVADLELARATAQATSATVTVSFDVVNDRYDIPGVPSLNDPGVDVGVDLSREPYHADLVAASFGGSEKVSFDGYGVPDNGGVIAVSCGTAMRTVNLDLETGLASVQ